MHLTFEGATIKKGITHDITLALNLEMGGFFMGSLHIGQTGVFYSTILHKAEIVNQSWVRKIFSTIPNYVWFFTSNTFLHLVDSYKKIEANPIL